MKGKAMNARLEALYKETYRSALQKELGISNIMAVPRISKIVINTGVKEAVNDSKVLGKVKDMIDRISGQTSVKTTARKSIAGFKLREGVAIGVRVTLRGKRMYAFLDRLINLALPSVRDFQGVTTRFDGRGNYNLGVKDWMVFPEIDYDTVDHSRGLNISIHTTATSDDDARALLRQFSMPFKTSAN
jgi:large subunit ribosomal protein L5